MNSFLQTARMLSLGKIFYKTGESSKSQKILSNIKTQFTSVEIADEKLMLLSRAARKMMNWDDTVVYWNQMIKTGRFGCYPYIELAKYYEHREKDNRLALEITSKAIKLLEFEREFISVSVYKIQYESLMKRHRRLKSKIDNS